MVVWAPLGSSPYPRLAAVCKSPSLRDSQFETLKLNAQMHLRIQLEK